ncbi:MAG: universal stress protein, partial [Chloroflexota bacterium]
MPYVEVLARASGATVTLIQVVAESDASPVQGANPLLMPFMVAYPTGDPRAESVAQRAERLAPAAYLDGIAERLGRRGVVTETVVVRGRPADLLSAEAVSRQADLIVVATHGHSGLRRWVFGSVAEAVLARSPVPVLMARAWIPPHSLFPADGRPTIVTPLDGSPCAEAALPLAQDLARLLGATLCLTRMVALPHVSPSLEMEVVVEYSPNYRSELERGACDYLVSVAARVRATGVDVDTSTKFSDPASGILASAHEREAGLIVMATHGRTGLASTLLGSVSLEVL